MTPTCLVLLLCDRVDGDASTGKASIIGKFKAVFAEQFPGVSPPFSVLVELTDGRGSPRFDLRIESLSPDSMDIQAIGATSFRLTFDDPRATQMYEARFVNGVALPVAGDYRVTLSVGSTVLAHRYFVAMPPA